MVDCAQAAKIHVNCRIALACLAAQHGQDECLRLIHASGITLEGSMSAAAAEAGTLSCLRLAYELGDRRKYSTARAAAGQGVIHNFV
jgi:hypothetical protein